MRRKPTAKIPDPRAPLGEVEWEVLLALADGAKHGYAILLDVESRQGSLRLLPGSLYRALHRLERERLVEETLAVDAPSSDARRRTFRLTTIGRQIAAAEALRLANRLHLAAARGLFELPEPS